MLLTLLFAAFLIPVTVGDVGVNYSFVLLPLLTILFTGRLRKPQDSTLVLMGLFSMIFIVAVLYQLEFIDFALRRFISFGIFMAIFTYAFIDVDDAMVRAFKTAVVGASAAMSLRMIVLYFMQGGAALGYGAKYVVGTQRIGFLYLVALWLVLLNPEAARWRFWRLAVAAILLAGLMLTFSRSSIAALVGSSAIFGLVQIGKWFRRPRERNLFRGLGAAVAAVALTALFSILVPIAFEYFRLYLFDIRGVFERLQTDYYSEGIRVVLLRKVLDFVASNPLTGSGFLGVWILPHLRSGSAHNQLSDVLFRTGFPGLVGYLYLLMGLLRDLHRHERDLFWGVVAVLIYGMFHETFKEPNGGFMLAFLVGMMSHRDRQAAFVEWRSGGESQGPRLQIGAATRAG